MLKRQIKSEYTSRCSHSTGLIGSNCFAVTWVSLTLIMQTVVWLETVIFAFSNVPELSVIWYSKSLTVLPLNSFLDQPCLFSVSTTRCIWRFIVWWYNPTSSLSLTVVRRWPTLAKCLLDKESSNPLPYKTSQIMQLTYPFALQIIRLCIFCQLLVLTLWHPLLSYGYNCKASCARPG